MFRVIKPKKLWSCVMTSPMVMNRTEGENQLEVDEYGRLREHCRSVSHNAPRVKPDLTNVLFRWGRPVAPKEKINAVERPADMWTIMFTAEAHTMSDSTTQLTCISAIPQMRHPFSYINHDIRLESIGELKVEHWTLNVERWAVILTLFGMQHPT